MTDKSQVDLNGDGVIDDKELNYYFEKTRTHKRIAIICLVAILALTIILLTPVISTERITALSDLISMFYIMTGSIIGTYMGTSTWMSVSKKTF